jgi:hypothetical protein
MSERTVVAMVATGCVWAGVVFMTLLCCLDPTIAWAWYWFILALLWPVGIWVPALTALLPGTFWYWSEQHRLNRRIRVAKAERELIALRKAAEDEEGRTSRDLDAYIGGAA